LGFLELRLNVTELVGQVAVFLLEPAYKTDKLEHARRGICVRWCPFRRGCPLVSVRLSDKRLEHRSVDQETSAAFVRGEGAGFQPAATNARYVEGQAELLASSVDAGHLAALAQLSVVGQRRVPGIKLHDDRVIRLLEILLPLAASSPTGPRATLMRDC
jgi:hypothetical protein